jgi:carboxyl-terminal processing protease
MLAELNDAHTFIDPFPALVWQFGSLSDIGGQAVISALDKTAQAAGLAVGDVLMTINGLNIEDAAAALPPRLRVSSTPWSSRAWALDNLLALWDGAESLTVTALGMNGEKTVILTPPDRPETDTSAPVITGERLSSGLGLIRIPRLWGSSRAELAAQFDAALEPLQDTPGLILDIRGNGGGSSLTAAEIAGRFIASPFIYAREYYRQRLSIHFWLPFGERVVYPRGPLYDGRLVLLTDARVLSSAEEFVLMLADSERASLVGRVTGGGSGNPLAFPLTGDAEARFSSGDLRRTSGERLEGAGISPDVVVTWSVDDLRAGRDPDIAAAEALLLAENG